TLTFTPANWNQAQTVTVTGIDDLTADGNQNSTVTISIDDANSDNAFDALVDQTATVTTTDNDVAAFTITESAGTTVSESGSTDSFTVMLDKQPLTEVVFNLESSDTGEATIDKSTLTFTPANWNQAQTVTVTGIDDVIVDGDQNSTITISVNDATSDNAFDALVDQTVSVTTTDDGDAHPPAIFDMALVQLPTFTMSDGSVASVPVSMAEVHEWEEFYLEIFMQLPPMTVHPLTQVQFTLDFDNALFQLDLANRELGGAVESLTQNSVTGQATFTATIQQGLTNYAADSPVLIARFPASTSIIANVNGVYPDESNSSLPVMSAAQVILDQLVDPVVSSTAANIPTSVRAVRYDINDNNRVDLSDLSMLVNSFGLDVNSNPIAYRADFDKDGRVGLTDLSRLVNHFGYQQGDSHEIVFPITQEPESIELEKTMLSEEVVSNVVYLKDTNLIPTGNIPEVLHPFYDHETIIISELWDTPSLGNPSIRSESKPNTSKSTLIKPSLFLDQLFESEDQLLDLAAQLDDDYLAVDDLETVIDDLFAEWGEEE
ncbi:MAG: hypothetical protein COA78_12590, partial [Blastopirellula sp.]